MPDKSSKKPMLSTFFDRDTKLAEAKAKVLALLTSWHEYFHGSLEMLKNQLGHECIEEEAVELFAAKAKVVKATLEQVTSNSVDAEDQLESFITCFSADATAASFAAKVPPCAKFQSLTTLKAMQEVSAELEECMTAKQLSDFMQDFNKPKPAFNDLKAAARKISGKLDSMLKAAAKERSKKRLQQKKAASSDALLPSGADLQGPIGIMDAAFDLEISPDTKLKEPTMVKLADVSDASTIADWSLPVLLTDTTRIIKLEGRPIHSAMEFNMHALLRDPRVDMTKGGAGKGQTVPRNPELEKEIHEVLFSMLGPAKEHFLPQVSKTDDLFKGMMWGMQKGTLHSGMERHHLGSLRYSHVGTRQVLAMSSSELEHHMKAQAVEMVKLGMTGPERDGQAVMGYSADMYRVFIDSLNTRQFQLLARSVELFRMTIVAGDSLYIPAGLQQSSIACVMLGVI